MYKVRLAFLFFLLCFLLCPICSHAQTQFNGSLTASDSGSPAPGCTTANACLSESVFNPNEPSPGAATVSISSATAFSGTVQFEISGDGGATWGSWGVLPSSGTGTAVTSATAAGRWQGNISGYTNIRVRCSTYVSGTIVVTINLSANSAKVPGGGGGGSFTAGGDLSGSSTSQEVVGVLSNALPSLATGYLNWTGSAWAFSSVGAGTVTTFSSGNLSPLFTTTVSTASTTPSLAFSLTNAAQNSVLAGPATGGAGAPSYQTAPTISAANMTNFPTFNQNTSGTAAGLSGSQTANTFYASPNGSTGTASFRAIVAADVPTLNQNTTGSAGSLSATLACGEFPALTGDTTTTAGACATTTAKINGTAFPTSATVVGSNSSAAPIAATTTGTGTTVVLGTGPTIANPVLTGSGSGLYKGYAVDTGSADAYAVALGDSSYTGAVAGAFFFAKFVNASNASSTITINGGTSRSLIVQNVATTTGSISANQTYLCIDDGTHIVAGAIPWNGGLYLLYDNTFEMANSTTNTKKMAFSLGNMTASTTLTISLPNTSGTQTLPFLGLAQTFSGAQTFSALGTFSSAGAASASGLTVTGAPYTGGSATTNFPQFYINDGTGPSTFSSAGTELGANSPSGFTGNFEDYHVNGGASVFSVNYQGNLVSTGTLSGTSFTSTGTTAGFVDFPQGSTSASVAPCNVATSICEQAPTSVTSYLVTKAGTGPANNNVTKSYTALSSSATTESFVHAAQSAVLTGSAYTNATTGFTNVSSTTNLSFTLDASTAYSGDCYLIYSASATTAGPDIQFTGPASPTAVNYSAAIQLTATPTYADSAAASAFSSSLASGTAVTASTRLAVRIQFGIVNGTTAGTLQLQAAANGTGTLTIEPGSYCRMQ